MGEIWRILLTALIGALLGGSGVCGMISWYLQRKAGSALDAKRQDKQAVEDAKRAAEKEVSDKLSAHDMQLQLQQDGITALLHDRIYQACTYHIHTGRISVEDLRNLEYMYEPYHKLGGNGICTELIERCKKLEMKVETDEK